jgi:deoxyribodipyrimidine photo-lyase
MRLPSAITCSFRMMIRPPSIAPERVRALNPRDPSPAGKYVLYWMQASQRAAHNPALEYAAACANELGLPLQVGFGLMDDYPEANARHYTFMLEGLRDVAAALAPRGIGFSLVHGPPPEVALRLGRDATLLVCDRGYLRHQRAWRDRVAAEAACRVVEVEGDVVVPVDAVSDKREFAARTIRPKIHRRWKEFLTELPEIALQRRARPTGVPTLDLGDIPALIRGLKLDASVPPVSALYRGGTAEAERVFREFCAQRFSRYAAHRNQPQTNDVSHMSKYLHFGQVSPVWLALEARRSGAPAEDVDTFLEELIVRRELGFNFVRHTPDYDAYATLPAWARTTLAEHRGDLRPRLYTAAQLDDAETVDPYWNAAQREMRASGYMHNAMRMYWGKKILEWSPSPEEAFATALALNNRYFLCGRDPVSYANVLWIFGLHDRPWAERPIFGKVRYMNAAGLERKCDIRGYVAKVERLCARVA